MEMKSFTDVVAYLEGFLNLEKKTRHYTTREYRLDRMVALLDHVGNPQQSFKTIHLAGSKGKGSTASFIASGLAAMGYKTGLYMSPHLVDYRERFTLSGTFFSDAALVHAGNLLKTLVGDFTFSDEWGETTPTTFELLTTFAYLLFKEEKCEWAVIETGLGGRLDATNTIRSSASVLCPIELEHTRILGSTIKEIAFEKAKIIKAGQPVFIGLVHEEAKEVFLQECREQHAKPFLLEEFLTGYEALTTMEGERVTLKWKNGTEDRLLLSMKGSVQAQNVALALLALRTLDLFGEQTIRALEANTVPGRFQQVAPSLYIDGAHTPASLNALTRSFSKLYPSKDANVVIYGALEDKDHLHMASIVLQHFNKIILSRPGTFKKSDLHKLFSIFEELKAESHSTASIFLIEDNSQALDKAYMLKGADGAILVCGSFYLGGGIAEVLKRR
jgi:dihydrofolate synthase/folylpolyglutamate synthase